MILHLLGWTVVAVIVGANVPDLRLVAVVVLWLLVAAAVGLATWSAMGGRP